MVSDSKVMSVVQKESPNVHLALQMVEGGLARVAGSSGGAGGGQERSIVVANTHMPGKTGNARIRIGSQVLLDGQC
jgi:hypothetical protein